MPTPDMNLAPESVKAYTMDLERISETLAGKFPGKLWTIDSHTAGEPTRLIVGGVEPLPGETLKDKRLYLMENLDHIRLLLTNEPRGHRDMLAALVTEPASGDADFGLIYMDARRYPFLCGHATIGAVTTLIETGVLSSCEPCTQVTVDTPSGPMSAKAYLSGGKVQSVAIQTVPSFVYGQDEVLDVPGLGTLSVDTVCVGGFFVMVAADQVGMELVKENSHKLIELGMTIIDKANEQLLVSHPTRPEVASIDVVEFYDPSGDPAGLGKNFVVYGESHMDRSPCGTGTAAKLTLLHKKGLIGVNEQFRNQSCLGSTFIGQIVAETSVGDWPAVVVEIRGSAHITGIHQFIIDPSDPFPQGFLP